MTLRRTRKQGCETHHTVRRMRDDTVLSLVSSVDIMTQELHLLKAFWRVCGSAQRKR